MKPAVLVSWALIGLASANPLPVANEIRENDKCRLATVMLRQAYTVWQSLVSAHAAADAIAAAYAWVNMQQKARDLSCTIT
ncbi:hypothetical protein PWT90_09902 [Aphanocladium album]|nr:hypothetical protein PWT90_09902 [Aphanocladium album]